jgi:hypothetical protein
MRFSGLILATICCGVAAFAQTAGDPQIKAGGVELTLPGPGDFREVGEKLRMTVFESLVPSTNRLLTAYVPASTLAQLTAGKASSRLELYAMLEVPKQTEYADCTPQAFEQVLKSLEPTMGKFDATKVGELEVGIDRRLKSLGAKPMEAGRPEMLGAVYQKTDSAGFAMLVAVKQGDRNVTMAGAFAVLRVKRRLIFAYLYRKYESPETVSLIRKGLESWGDGILAKNVTDPRPR